MIRRFTPKLSSPALRILALAVALAPNFLRSAVAPGNDREPATAAPLNWTTSARWHHGLKKISGTLLFNDHGVEFQGAKGKRIAWPFEEIQTFNLSPHQFKLTGYANRKWRLHGERSFRFDLKSAVPPIVAAQLARHVGKPAKNGDPTADALAFATLPARHQTRSGGTNGALRFRDTGIDYVTTDGRGARSWRWQDVETLANPDPYHFRVGGFREVFSFELKQPMTKELFDRLWNDFYAGGLSGLATKEGAGQ